ncbi:hypothetical protein BHM03_00049860 [Ensete ventricosum]|nr:hypothetical protein BHM03_00049860 [Ensete ventricosum]
MNEVDVEDGTWSGDMNISLDRGQGHELLQSQEQDHVVPWVLHFDGADSSCMVPKTKGAARYMHLVSEMHLTEELRRFNLRRWSKGARKRRVQRGSATQKLSVNHNEGGLEGVPQRRIYRSQERDVGARKQIVVSWAWQCHGTAEAGLPWSHRYLALMEGERWL